MPRVLMDASLAQALKAASDVVELVDEAGRVLGVYTPVRKHVPPPGYKPPFTDEELDGFAQERDGRSLAEILKDLNAKHGGP